MKIRKTNLSDVKPIFDLYQKVATTNVGLIRTADEITQEYVTDFVQKSIEKGISLVVENENAKIAAEIHTFPMGIRAFDHILSNATMAVDPAEQGKGIGKKLFEYLLDEIKNHRTDIGRIEVFARETNNRSINLCEKLGFKKEGRLPNRIRLLDGSFETDILMAWINPKFKFS